MATKSIGSAGGRDYATLALWAAYVNALALSAAEIGEMYNDTEFSIAAVVTIGGYTGNSATNTVTLTAAAGQSFQDNANVQSNALRYNQSNGVGVRQTSNYTNTLSITGNNFFLKRVQVKNGTSGTSSGSCVNFAAGSGGVEIAVLQSYGSPGAGTGNIRVSGSSNTFQNIAGIDGGNGHCVRDASYGANTYTDISGVCSKSGGGSGNTGYIVLGANVAVLTNCTAFGYATDYSGTAKNTSKNNATDKASFGGTNYGTSGQTSAVGATEWQSVTAGSEDLRLNSTSAKLKDNGATVGPTTDIAGTSRPQGSAYDIGCWELIAAAANNFFPAIVMGRSQSLVF